MPAPVRPKGSGSSRNSAPVTPMSERQQMALLMQLTSSGNSGDNSSTAGSRSPSSGSNSAASAAAARSRERNERGETPLHLAAIKGDVEQVGKLLAHRADPNVADFAGWTPLHEACNHGRYEVALRLVQSGANVNARGLDDDTPLHDAAANGHLRLARMLVERGADPRAKNSKGRTPLDVAPASVRPFLLDLSLPLPESTGSRVQPRSRDDKKVPAGAAAAAAAATAGGGGSSGASNASGAGADSAQGGKQQKEEQTDVKTTTAEDVYEFKTGGKESGGSESGGDSKSVGADVEMNTETSTSAATAFAAPQTNEEGAVSTGTSKRTFSETTEGVEESTAGANSTAAASNNEDESRRKKRKDDNTKEGKVTTPRSANQNKGQSGKQSSGGQNKSGASSVGKNADKKSPCSSPKPSVSDQEVEDGKTDLKVPPLKIVIPQTNNSEQEATGRNGKSSSQRAHPALPYVVPSSNTSANAADTSSEKEQSSTASSLDTSTSSKGDEKKETTSNTSDETQPLSETETSSSTNNTNAPTTTTATSTPAAPPVELHPRKRKLKQNKEAAAAAAAAAQQEPVETPAEAQVHPHEQPITNCYKLFLNIRKQIGKRRRGLFPVQPKPPSGFKDYLMNRCTYVLAGNAPTTPNVNYPQNLPAQLKDIFTDQEKERYRLRTQHVIEKEKLVLSVEQEILRVHGRAARALANQSLPFSVCTMLRDEEVYNLITPEQEEKDRNARSRYNGRLFLSWLQDVDDKWEKIKEHMLLRHHNEAESLHAVQKMDWEWKMKELSLCDRKTTPKIEEAHVPMVYVSDDFDLLPAP